MIAVFWPLCRWFAFGGVPKSSDWLFPHARKALRYIYDRHPICPTHVSFHYSWVHTANLLGQWTIDMGSRLWAPKDL